MEEFAVDPSTHKELLRQRTLLEEALETLKAKEKKDMHSYQSRLSIMKQVFWVNLGNRI